MNQFETNNVDIPPEWENNPTLRNMGRFYRNVHTPNGDSFEGLIFAILASATYLFLTLSTYQSPRMDDQPPYRYTIEKSQRLEDVTGGYLSPDKFTKPKGQTNQ